MKRIAAWMLALAVLLTMVTVPALAAIPTTTLLRIMPNGMDGATLTWEEVNGAEAYYVYTGTEPGKVNQYLAGTTACTYTVQGLEPGSTHYFAVCVKQTVNGSVQKGALSNVYAFTVPLDGGKEPQQPAKQPSAPVSGTMKITGTHRNDNGSVTVTWSDTAGNTPYRLEYRLAKSGIPAGAEWYYDEGNDAIYTREGLLDCLVPGTSYELRVVDARGSVATGTITMPKASSYTIPVDVSHILKTRVGSTKHDTTNFSAASIKAGKEDHGAYIRLNYSRLARQRDHRFMVTLTAPDGTTFADLWTDDYLPAGHYYYYWDFYSFDYFFEKIAKELDTVPRGTYTWALYLDGMIACSFTFNVVN